MRPIRSSQPPDEWEPLTSEELADLRRYADRAGDDARLVLAVLTTLPTREARAAALRRPVADLLEPVEDLILSRLQDDRATEDLGCRDVELEELTTLRLAEGEALLAALPIRGLPGGLQSDAGQKGQR